MPARRGAREEGDRSPNPSFRRKGRGFRFPERGKIRNKMERKPAYGALADWFEYLNDDCGYEEWSQYLISEVGRFPVHTGLDIGCGSGRFTREFRRAGYGMTGMDLSIEMLNKAEELSGETGIACRYLQGDIARFRSPEKFDFALAINDCVNYLSKEKLLPAFRNVRAALHKNGIFLFDISSPCKFRGKIADTVCADDRDDVTYLCFNTVEGDRAALDVTLFVRRPDGAFDRFDEQHIQYIYEPCEIREALEQSGFTLLKEEGFLGAAEEGADRICFLAQKR